jgi:hypothetical protein
MVEARDAGTPNPPMTLAGVVPSTLMNVPYYGSIPKSNSNLGWLGEIVVQLIFVGWIGNEPIFFHVATPRR